MDGCFRATCQHSHILNFLIPFSRILFLSISSLSTFLDSEDVLRQSPPSLHLWFPATSSVELAETDSHAQVQGEVWISQMSQMLFSGWKNKSGRSIPDVYAGRNTEAVMRRRGETLKSNDSRGSTCVSAWRQESGRSRVPFVSFPSWYLHVIFHWRLS